MEATSETFEWGSVPSLPDCWIGIDAEGRAWSRPTILAPVPKSRLKRLPAYDRGTPYHRTIQLIRPPCVARFLAVIPDA